MRVLVAGASGALGIPLIRLLVARGHSVVGLIRNPAGADGVRALGAEPLVADALDRDGLLRAVNGLTADAVIHELTSLRRPPLRANGMAVTNRLRTEGTANLLAVGDRLGAKRMVTQSIIFGYGDTSMQVSNTKAKNELAWQPRVTTYREGIAAMVSDLCREDPNLSRLPADRLQAGM